MRYKENAGQAQVSGASVSFRVYSNSRPGQAGRQQQQIENSYSTQPVAKGEWPLDLFTDDGTAARHQYYQCVFVCVWRLYGEPSSAVSYSARCVVCFATLHSQSSSEQISHIHCSAAQSLTHPEAAAENPNNMRCFWLAVDGCFAAVAACCRFFGFFFDMATHACLSMVERWARYVHVCVSCHVCCADDDGVCVYVWCMGHDRKTISIWGSFSRRFRRHR